MCYQWALNKDTHLRKEHPHVIDEALYSAGLEYYQDTRGSLVHYIVHIDV